MIINIFMIFLFKYALRFLKILIKIKNKLNKKYYKLILNNKIRDTIRNLYSYYSINKGEIKDINLYFIMNVNTIITINKIINDFNAM